MMKNIRIHVDHLEIDESEEGWTYPAELPSNATVLSATPRNGGGVTLVWMEEE